MPSKYYNPRLARSVGSAQDAGYTSVSGVIDKAFEPLEEQMAIRQERLFQEKERERQQREQYEKDSAKYYESMAGLEGQIEPGHQEAFREHLQARFEETKKCMDKNVGDPVAIAKCKGGLSTEINTIANTYSSWRKSQKDRLDHEREFGVSEVNDEKDMAKANRLMNIGNEKIDFSTGKPRTYRVDENGNPIMKTDGDGNFIVDENGFGQIDYFDFAEEAKNFSLIDNSGTSTHHSIVGKIATQMKSDLKNKTNPEIGMMMLNKNLKDVTPKNALHILTTQFKMAGVDNELNRFFRDAERNDTSTGIYFDMPNDLDPEKYEKFWNASDEERVKMGAVKIQGERAIVELLKDQYRYLYAKTMQDEIDRIKDNTPGDEDDSGKKDSVLLTNVKELITGSIEDQMSRVRSIIDPKTQQIDFDENLNVVTLRENVGNNKWVDIKFDLDTLDGSDPNVAPGNKGLKAQGKKAWLQKLANLYLKGKSQPTQENQSIIGNFIDEVTKITPKIFSSDKNFLNKP